MEVRIKENVLFIKHKLRNNETYRVSKGSRFQSVTIMKRPQEVVGFSNITEDNHSVLFIDYDGVDTVVVLEDYKFIQNKFALPPAYLIQTRENNFHVVCVKKFPHSLIPEILMYTRADENYKTMPLRSPYRSYVLRLSTKKGSSKPFFVGLIGDMVNLDFEVSSAHKRLIERLHLNVPKVPFKKEDGLSKVKLQRYETGGAWWGKKGEFMIMKITKGYITG